MYQYVINQSQNEDTVAFKDRFINDVQQLNNSFSANPFTAHTLSPFDNLSIVYDDEIESNIKNIVAIGQRQFECYFEERLIKTKTLINATIKSNSLRLPGKNFTVKKSKVEQSLTPVIISKIKPSYQFRREEVCNLFKEVLFQRAHSISEDENTLYHGTKSDTLERLNSTEKPNLNPKNRNAIIFDLSAIVRSRSKSNCLTFHYFANYTYRIIMLMSKNYERCEIVADRYFEGSLKEGTRNKRGAEGSKLIFNGESLMSKDFSSNFLANSENKENLNIFLAKKFVDFHKNSSQVLVVTLNDEVCSNKEYVFTEELIDYCNVD